MDNGYVTPVAVEDLMAEDKELSELVDAFNETDVGWHMISDDTVYDATDEYSVDAVENLIERAASSDGLKEYLTYADGDNYHYFACSVDALKDVLKMHT